MCLDCGQPVERTGWDDLCFDCQDDRKHEDEEDAFEYEAEDAYFYGGS